MTRDIYIRTKSRVRRYPLGKNVKPLTIIGRRLYRTDDSLMIADASSDHQLLMYDIDDTQPYFNEPLDPDVTMAMIDIAKSSGDSPKRLGALSGMNPMWLVYGAIAVVVVYAVIAGGIA